MSRELIRSRLTATTGILLLGATAVTGASVASGTSGADDESPATLELTGIVRDFRERSKPGGHPDFERRPGAGYGHYVGNVAVELGVDGNPVFTGDGHKLRRQYTTSGGTPIAWTQYDPDRGDRAGVKDRDDPGGIQSAESFAQWFEDVPGVNVSQPLPLTLHLQDDGSYVFDDREDDAYKNLGGFFPLEAQGFGNPGGSPDRNFHFTFELHTSFIYNADGNQVFTFRGDDDVWVFIDDRLVIDVGGVHGAITQSVLLDRLGLEHGESYKLSFFFAERHRTQSNFRIQTNLNLRPLAIPTTLAAFD